MQISKSAHLKRLLRTQDVLLSVLAYLVAVNFIWLVDLANSADVINHFFLIPFVFLFSIVASMFENPGLHGKRMVIVALLALRYAATVVVCLLAVAYFGKLEFVSRYAVGLFAFLLVSGLLSNRLFLRWWYFTGRREYPDNFLQVLVVGSGSRAHRLMEVYRDNSDWGITIIGMLDPKPDQNSEPSGDVPVIGNTREISRILTEHVVDEVIICLPRTLLNDVEGLVTTCAEEGVCIKFLADLYEVEGGSYSLEQIGSWPVLSLDPISSGASSMIVKRIVDLLITIPAILFLSPVFLLTIALIKLDSPGPAFFKQTRVGLNKRKFQMIKFRSMYQDAEQRLAEIEHLNEASGPIFKMKNDPRVTRIGRFIRRASIDEWSLWLDVKILVRLIPAVISGDGAS